MRFLLPNYVSPHYCCSCGDIGRSLCDRCRYDIVDDVPAQCIACLTPVGGYGDICSRCNVPYARGWFVAYHRTAIRALIGLCKFRSKRAVAYELAALLHEALPQLPPQTVVVPVPTVTQHVRRRGFNHTAIIARRFARLRSLRYKRLLLRNSTTTQRGASRAQRIKQAARAFTTKGAVAPDTYLVVDDVCTTGATLYYAADTLKHAGAATVWVAAVSREPLD